MLLHFKLSKLGQSLCVDNTGFPRPSRIYNITALLKVSYKIKPFSKKHSTKYNRPLFIFTSLNIVGNFGTNYTPYM